MTKRKIFFISKAASYQKLCCVQVILIIIFLCIHNPRNEKKEIKSEERDDNCVLWLKGPPKQDDPKVLKILRTKYIDNPSTKPYNLSSNPYYKASKRSASWPVIYNALGRIIQNMRNGFFVEAGALDGEFLSNTLWLEKELGWTGLLIESNTLSYRKLLAKNRKAWTSNTCLSIKPYPYQATFVSVSEDKHDSKSYNPWIYKGASHLLGYTMSPAYQGVFTRSFNSYSTVQCFPLYSYILALNRTEIDLLVLDIQGAEDEVISTIPFDKLKIKILVVEHSSKNSFDADFNSYFEERGFRLLQCYGEPDYIFILRNEFNIADYNVTECALNLYR